jgi:hypothetical protein
MDVIYANPELNPTLSGYEKVCTTNAKFKTLGEATGRATIEGVEYMLSQPIVGIVNDAVLNSPRFIFLIHFKSKDFDTINSTFESFAALRIRNY